MTTNIPPCEVGWGGTGWDDPAAGDVDEPDIGWGDHGWAEDGTTGFDILNETASAILLESGSHLLME